MVASIMQQWFRFAMFTLLQKHEEEQRLVELPGYSSNLPLT